MILIIGLGNPGKYYARTRHNVGFMMVDKLQEEWNFPEFEFNKKFDTEISEGKINPPLPPGEGGGEGKILLAKPQTFMNRSGEAVKKIMKFYKLKPSDIIVIHDDLDIDLGKFKISADSSAAGHRGVESIIDALGTKNFKRLRIGIEGTEMRKKRKIPGDKFVLKKFTESEKKKVSELLTNIEREIQTRFQ
jgi:peptidyl-tRNA hydrolase, PTH1 family